VTVDCARGGSISSVLAAYENFTGRLTITVAGVCHETVTITRDDVTLRGRTPADGLAPPVGSAINLSAAHRIRLDQLRLVVTDVFQDGVRAMGGSEFTASGLESSGGFAGVLSSEGSVGTVIDTLVHDSDNGAYADRAFLKLVGLTARDVGVGITASEGGTVQVLNGHVHNTRSWGVSATAHSVVSLESTTIENTVVGLFLVAGSTGSLAGPTVIRNSTAAGVRVWEQSFLSAGGGSVIERNGGDGVEIMDASLFAPFRVRISDNRGDGISVSDTSVSRGGTGAGTDPEIRNNGGWGIACASAPAVAQVSGRGYDALLVTGNALGASNCPALSFAGRVP
jgi:hypothetical protein